MSPEGSNGFPTRAVRAKKQTDSQQHFTKLSIPNKPCCPVPIGKDYKSTVCENN